MGFHWAGFDVIGVDIEPQPNYPFEFVQGDWSAALQMAIASRRGFDAIHASPPCPAYSVITSDPTEHPRLIAPVRDKLRASGLPYVIENVEGAARDMIAPVRLCGSAFGLKVRRHRLFESNVGLMSTPCNHRAQGKALGVYGHIDGPNAARGSKHGDKARTLDEAREAMGMPWASWNGCREAIPPTYTEFIGDQLMAHLQASAAS
jgi:DNA (cytosine-5)-methyltransferase 1